MQGRLQVVGEDPLTVLDGAHNPDATRALIEALPEVLDARPPRPLALVLGVLEDKDAASMLATLLPCASAPGSPRPRAAVPCRPRRCSRWRASLASTQWFASRSPWRALAEAQRWARERGEDAAVLATGSVYLVGDLLAHCTSADDGSSADGSSDIVRSTVQAAVEGAEMNDDGPSVLKMIGAVALIVALVILVFFAAGYGFGRLFL